MKIRKYVGMPDHVTGFNPFLPDTGDGTAGGTNGGAGAAPVAPAAPIAPLVPAGQPVMGAPVVGPNGFAEGTPLAELPVEQREAYWKFHARKHEDASKAHAAELEALRPKAQQYEALEAASRTDQERAIAEARSEAEKAGREAAMAEARTIYGVQLVQVRLDAALTVKGLTKEQMAALAGDGTRFLGDKGVDAAALDAFLAALPDKAASPAGPVPPVNLGGGRTAPVEAGIDGNAAYERRHGRKIAPSA